MLWRVRATLPDRPGALAVLATRCGEGSVNILGFQISPGVDPVTDDLVLDTPGGWAMGDVAALVERSGGDAVSVARCTEAALTDQPTRYVRAAAAVLAAPPSFPDVLAKLFDAEAESASGGAPCAGRAGPDGGLGAGAGAPYGALHRDRTHPGPRPREPGGRRGRPRRPGSPTGVDVESSGGPEYVVGGTEATAVVDRSVVRSAAIRPALDEPDACVLTLIVEPAWRRQGIGSRLVAEAVRLAAARDAGELVLTTRADNQAVLPMVLAAGLRGRIRMSGDRLTVRIPLAALQR